jgi:hypothetical protein
MEDDVKAFIFTEVSVKIRVTRGDIRKGDPVNCRTCPIARALNRITKQTWLVGPETAMVEIGTRGIYKRFPLTEEMTKFVLDFDRGRPVIPTTFLVPKSTITGSI